MTTIRELITGSLRLINVVQANESPTSDDMDISLEALNAMVDSWSNDRLDVYHVDPHFFPFIPGQKKYTLGPDGDWCIERPMEIMSGYVRQSVLIPEDTPEFVYRNYVIDEFTMSQFHFDTPGDYVLNSVSGAREMYLNPDWEVTATTQGLYTGALKVPADRYQSSVRIDSDDGTTPTQQTVEFALLNLGPGDDTNALLLETRMANSGGESVIEMDIVKDENNGTPVLQFFDPYGESYVFEIPFPEYVWTFIAYEFDTDTDILYVYQDGVRVYDGFITDFNQYVSHGASLDPMNYIRLQPGANAYLDEFRQSNTFRDLDATYDLQVTMENPPTPNPIPEPPPPPVPDPYPQTGETALRNAMIDANTISHFNFWNNNNGVSGAPNIPDQLDLSEDYGTWYSGLRRMGGAGDIYLANDNITAPLQQTHEFAIRPVNTSGGYRNVATSEVALFGPTLMILRYAMDPTTGRIMLYGTNTTIFDLPMDANPNWTIVAVEWDLVNNLFSAYVNGTRVADGDLSLVHSSYSGQTITNNYSNFQLQTGFDFDEYRQSDIKRYNAASYPLEIVAP